VFFLAASCCFFFSSLLALGAKIVVYPLVEAKIQCGVQCHSLCRKNRALKGWFLDRKGWKWCHGKEGGSAAWGILLACGTRSVVGLTPCVPEGDVEEVKARGEMAVEMNGPWWGILSEMIWKLRSKVLFLDQFLAEMGSSFCQKCQQIGTQVSWCQEKWHVTNTMPPGGSHHQLLSCECWF